MPQRVWLDTDIGDDTDDILALALIATSPELRLAGVSTVFGHTLARAELASAVLATTRRVPRVPVAAGCGRPFPGDPAPSLWPNGSTRRPVPVQWPSRRLARQVPPISRRHGVDLLGDELRSHPGKTIPICIGALTNLATLILRSPELVGAIPRLAIMGGEFKRPEAEWNVRCDPLAAACVFASGVPADVIPWDIGMRCTVTPAQLARLHAGRSRGQRLLSDAVRRWQKAKSTPDCLQHPHLFDPMTVALLFRPDWFEWRRGRIDVSFAPESFGRTLFTPDRRGPHRVAWEVKSLRCIETVWRRILML